MSVSSRRAQATAAVERRHDPLLRLISATLAASVFAVGVARGQVPTSPAVPPADTPNTAVPEVIAPTIPPGAGGSGTVTPQPRSENPLSPTPSVPVPDAGIVVTPPSDAGQTPVVRPPPGISNTPVIPPPGLPGGGGAVVPR